MSIRITLRLLIVLLGFVLLAEVLSLLPPPPIPLVLDYSIHYCIVFGLPFIAFLLVLRRAPSLQGLSKTTRVLILFVGSAALMFLADFVALMWLIRFGGRSHFPY